MNITKFISSTDPPVKLKSYKRDLAPIMFYFDVFSTDLFKIPIMPVPMRIDKLTNGEATLFIYPDMNEIQKLSDKLGIIIDWNKFFSIGINNLTNYAKTKYKEITFRNLKNETISKWFEKTKIIKAEIPSLTQDFTFMILEFIKFYSTIIDNCLDKNHKDYVMELCNFCDIISNYFLKRMEKNEIIIKDNNGSLKTFRIYKKRKEKYYPEVITIDLINLVSNKNRKRNFIPYLIYDDILDIFAYNKEKLLSGDLEYKSLINILEIYNDQVVFTKKKYYDKKTNYLDEIQSNKILNYVN